MTIAIIGAGLAGLSAARALIAAGREVVLLDKGRGVGGRMATRRFAEGVYDTGAQFFTVRDPRFAAEIARLEAAGVVAPWCQGFPLLGSTQAADGFPRYRAIGGMNRVAKHLASGLTVRSGVTVTGLVASSAGWTITVEPGDLAKPGAAATGPAETLAAGAVILTAPAPQAAALLTRSGLPVDAQVAAVRYAPCLCLLLSFPTATGPLLPDPGGLRLGDDPAVSWLASQRAKGLITAGEGLVVHATPEFSAQHYGRSDAEILAALVPAALAALARAGITIAPAVSELKKWKFSLPVVTVPAETLRVPAAAPLWLAGDAFGDRPRVEGAWLSGLAAAQAIG